MQADNLLNYLTNDEYILHALKEIKPGQLFLNKNIRNHKLSRNTKYTYHVYSIVNLDQSIYPVVMATHVIQ